MELERFPEVTRTYAEHQPQYRSLPCYAFPDDLKGRIAFCWRLSWCERLRVLLTGRLWQQVLTFGQPLQPQLLSADKPEMPSAPR